MQRPREDLAGRPFDLILHIIIRIPKDRCRIGSRSKPTHLYQENSSQNNASVVHALGCYRLERR